MKRAKSWRRVAVLPAAALTGAALAQPSSEPASEAAIPTLPTVTATAAAAGSLTAPGIAQQRQSLFQSAGSVGFVDAASYSNTYASDLRDVLKDAPGVYVQERYGVLAISDTNPDRCTPNHQCGGHDPNHKHGPGCGHEAVPHGDHVDYLVGDHLHHPHGDHCDDHGPLLLA